MVDTAICTAHWYCISLASVSKSGVVPRPVARGGAGGAMNPPNLPKGPLLATKWAKNGVFVGG